MSKKSSTQEMASDEIVDSPFPVRRSSRILTTQTTTGSPAPKTISTRRSSAANANERNSSESISPVLEKRRTRRASTEIEVKAATVKSRRSSASMLIEESKTSKVTNSPVSKRNTRASNNSPNRVADVPARRTRRSMSREQDIVEEVPARRTRGRKPSTETSDEVLQETDDKPKPVTRRRRSSSIDEQEETDISDANKVRTKRLFSEDNQLEPIEEQETEMKEDDEKAGGKSAKNTKKTDLSIIEETENIDAGSENVTKLRTKDSPLKLKTSLPESDSIKDALSSTTPKEGEQEEPVEKESTTKPIIEKKKSSTVSKNDIVEEDSEKIVSPSGIIELANSNDSSKEKLGEDNSDETIPVSPIIDLKISDTSNKNVITEETVASNPIDALKSCDNSSEVNTMEDKSEKTVSTKTFVEPESSENVISSEPTDGLKSSKISLNKTDSMEESCVKISPDKSVEEDEEIEVVEECQSERIESISKDTDAISKNEEPNDAISSKSNIDDVSIKSECARNKTLITMGSDDSFSVNLNKSILDRTQSNSDLNSVDSMTSPGSDKENMPPLKQSKAIEENIMSNNVFKEVDGSKTAKISDPEVKLTVANINVEPETIENMKDQPTDISSSDQMDCMENSNENIEPAKDVSSSSLMNNIKNSNEDVKEEILTSSNNAEISSASLGKLEKSPIIGEIKANILSCVKIVQDPEEDLSSDLSIKLVDSDEDVKDVSVEKKEEDTVPYARRSKRRRISDGSSKVTHQRLQMESESDNVIPTVDESVDSISDDSEQEQNSVKLNESKQKSPKTDADTNETNQEILFKKMPNTSELLKRNDEKDEKQKPEMSLEEAVSNTRPRKSSPNKNKARETDTKIDSIILNSEDDSNSVECITDIPLKQTIQNIENTSKKSESPKKKSATSPSVKMSKEVPYKSNSTKSTPTKIKGRLDEEVSDNSVDLSSKLDNPSEMKSMSEDFEEKNEFLDDMAEEGEEDTPSEGSNDIIDEGESINTTESEVDTDESDDSNDSFVVRDEEEDELLSGEEYDLEMDDVFEDEEKIKNNPKKKSRIIKQVDSSDEEIEVVSPRNRDESLKKKENERKSKKISLDKAKSFAIENSFNNDDVEGDVIDTNLKEEMSPRKTNQVPSIEVHMVDSSSEEEPVVEQKLPVERKRRSLLDMKKSSTPNSSLSEILNSSRQSNSGRSSSIIIQENVSVTDVQEDILIEKFQTVVKAFCSGIKTTDGNISMNVSLDYVESTSNRENANNITNDDGVMKNEQNSNSLDNSKSRTSLSGNIIRRESLKRRSTEMLVEDVQNTSDSKLHALDQRQKRSLEVTVVSYSSDDDEKTKSSEEVIQTESPRKKQKSRKSLNEIEVSIEKEPPKQIKKSMSGSSNTADNIENREENESSEEIHRIESPRKKRKSLNEVEVSIEKHQKQSRKSLNSSGKIVDNSENHQDWRKEGLEIQSTKISEHLDNDDFEIDVIEKNLPCVSKIGPNKKSNRNKKTVSTTSIDQKDCKLKKTDRKRKVCLSESNPDVVSKKRSRYMDMKCEELSMDDLRHRLPSKREEITTQLLKQARNVMEGLVTDVKNRPRRLLKPSSDTNELGWIIQDGAMKLSASNTPKCNFDFKQFDARDFKNQMMYSGRIKREDSSVLLRRKGHLI